MNARPQVSIIILNWNGYENTLQCLESLKHLDYPSFDLTILDNGSRRDEAALLAPHVLPRTRLLRLERNLGFAGGVNHCARVVLAAKPAPDYVLLLNNDVEVAPDFLSKLVDASESEPRLGITGPVISETETNRTEPVTMGKIHWYTGKTTYDHTIPDALWAPADLVHGCCFLVKLEVLEKVGLLDENYFAYYEETDLCVRASRAGYQVGLVPAARVSHLGSASAKRVSGMQEFLMIRNRIWFVRKNGTVPQWLATVLFCALFYGPRRALRALVKGEPKAFLAVVRGFLSGLGRRTIAFP